MILGRMIKQPDDFLSFSGGNSVSDLADDMEFEESGHEITLGIIKDPAGIFDQISLKFLDHISPLELDLLCDITACRAGGDVGL